MQLRVLGGKETKPHTRGGVRRGALQVLPLWQQQHQSSTYCMLHPTHLLEALRAAVALHWPCSCSCRYTNVSLEFNTLTLQPTYKLLWGSAGK